MESIVKTAKRAKQSSLTSLSGEDIFTEELRKLKRNPNDHAKDNDTNTLNTNGDEGTGDNSIQIPKGDTTEAELRRLYNLFDEDGNGSISREEFVVLMSRHLKIPDNEIEELLHEVDADGDGEISFEEFKQIFNEHNHKAIPLYAPPVQLQRWGEGQVLAHVNWGDLFFDLFYVSSAYNLGNLLISFLNKDLYSRGIVYFIGIFGGLYQTWESKVEYDARYHVLDYSHRILEVARVFFLSFSVLHIKSLEDMSDPKSNETFYFSLGMFLASLVPVLQKCELLLVGEGDIEAIKNHSKRALRVKCVPITLFYLAAVILSGVLLYGNYETDNSGYKDAHIRSLASSTSHKDWNIADLPISLFFIAYICNTLFTAFRRVYYLPNMSNFKEHNIPSNIDFAIHRYGEWIMLMLGESVLSLLIVETSDDQKYYVIACLGILTVIVLQALKFESDPHDADNHALWRNMRAGFTFSVLIQLLSVSLIAFGVSYKVMLKGVNANAYPAEGSDYDTNKLTDDAHRSLSFLPIISRRLAAMAPVNDKTVAALFCASLTIILASIELMGISHRGFDRFKHRFFRQEGQKKVLNWPFASIHILKLILVLFTATLSQWLTDPVEVTISGFCISVGFTLTKFMGWIIRRIKKKKTHKRMALTRSLSVGNRQDGQRHLGVSLSSSEEEEGNDSSNLAV